MSGDVIKKYIGKFFTWCLEKGEKGGEKLKAKAGRGLPLALLLFVGIPLPGTGAWTGTLAASLLDMDFKSSVRACMGGVLLAGCAMQPVDSTTTRYRVALVAKNNRDSEFWDAVFSRAEPPPRNITCN